MPCTGNPTRTISAAPRIPVAPRSAGYYVVAESLANSLKHAQASHMTINLARNNGTLSISVRDDGRGFEPTPTSGNGLANLSERVAALGGQLRITTRPGHGTTIVADLDLSDTPS